jgi:hypothetical protein
MLYIRNPFDKLVIGKNLQYIGIANWGSGYHNAKPSGEFYGDIIGGQMGVLMSYASAYGDKTVITVNSSNKYYKVINDVLYQLDETTGVPVAAVCSANTEITNLVLEDSVITVEDNAFMFCDKIQSITLGSKLERIGQMSFDCPIAQITYKGSMSQWNKIDKADGWDRGNYNPNNGIAVKCSDGTVAK